MRDKHEWSEEEDVRLTELFVAGLSHAKIGQMIGLSDSAAGKRCLQLGLRRGRRGVNGSARQNGPPSDDDSKIGTRKIKALVIKPLCERSERVQAWFREIMERSVTR